MKEGREMNSLISVADSVMRIRFLMTKLVDRTDFDEPVTYRQRYVLRVLERCPMTKTEYARRHHVTREHARKTFDKLLETEYVEGVPNPSNKRAPLVQLTDAGRQMLTEHTVALSAFLDGILPEAVYGDEVKEAVHTLHKIHDAVDAWIIRHDLDD